MSKWILVSVPVVVGTLTVFLGISAAGYGARLSLLERKIHELETQNKDLSQELVSSTSLQELSSKVSELGFIKPTNIVYVSNSLVATAQK